MRSLSWREQLDSIPIILYTSIRKSGLRSFLHKTRAASQETAKSGREEQGSKTPGDSLHIFAHLQSLDRTMREAFFEDDPILLVDRPLNQQRTLFFIYASSEVALAVVIPIKPTANMLKASLQSTAINCQCSCANNQPLIPIKD